MRVIVSDSSVLIDVAKARLIESALALPYKFVVPDVMLAELLDSDSLLESYTWEELKDSGLRAEKINGEGVAIAFKYAARYQRLSNRDAFALALANTSESILLTGDGALRQAASKERVDVHGHLWLVDNMESHETVTRERLLAVLKDWKDNPLVRLPAAELKERIDRLQGSRK